MMSSPSSRPPKPLTPTRPQTAASATTSTPGTPGPRGGGGAVSTLHTWRGALALVVTVTAWRLATLVEHPLNLSFDEAQYWLWSQSLELGYFSKPPLIGWVIAMTTRVCGDGEACVRLGSPLAYMAAAMALFAVGRRLYDPGVGFWTTAVFITLPGVAVSSMLISVDPLLLMAWAVGLAFLVRALEDPRPGWWVLLGVIVGVGLLAKYAMVFFLVSLVFYLAWSPSRRRLLRTPGPWLTVAVALAVLSPNLVWNVTHSFATLAHTSRNAALSGDLFHPDKGAAFLGSLFGVFGPLTMAALVWLVVRARRVVVVDEAGRLLLAFALPVLAVMTVEAFLSRANANWSAPAFVSATVLVVAWLRRVNKAWVLKVSVALHLAAAALLYNLDAIAATVGMPLTARTDPFKRVRGWDRIGQQVAGLWLAEPNLRLLFDQRKVLTPVVYYAEPHPFNAVKWNEAGHIGDHFDLTTDISRDIGASFLLVTEEPDAGHVAPFFAGTELVALLRVPIHADFVRQVRVYRCTSFKGYRPQ